MNIKIVISSTSYIKYCANNSFYLTELCSKIPYKIVIKYFENVYVTNGYIEAQPFDFGLNTINYMICGHKIVPKSCITTGYYFDGKKSYVSVYNIDGTPYSGAIGITVVAFGN